MTDEKNAGTLIVKESGNVTDAVVKIIDPVFGGEVLIDYGHELDEVIKRLQEIQAKGKTPGVF